MLVRQLMLTFFLKNVNECLSAFADWMDSNHQQLNNVKTKFRWCTNSRRQHHLPASGQRSAVHTSNLPQWLTTCESSSTRTCRCKRMLTGLSLSLVVSMRYASCSCAISDGSYRLLFSSHWSLRFSADLTTQQYVGWVACQFHSPKGP